MKLRIIIVINLLFVFMFSLGYARSYQEYKFSNVDGYKAITINDEVTPEEKEDIIKITYELCQEYGLDMTYMEKTYNTNKEYKDVEVIKYVYYAEAKDQVESVSLKSGRLLNYDDMGTNNFVSTEKANVESQVGELQEVWPSNDYYIYPVSAYKNSENDISTIYVETGITQEEVSELESFMTDFSNQAGIPEENIDVSGFVWFPPSILLLFFVEILFMAVMFIYLMKKKKIISRDEFNREKSKIVKIIAITLVALIASFVAIFKIVDVQVLLLMTVPIIIVCVLMCIIIYINKPGK